MIQNLNCYVIATGMIFVLFCSKKKKTSKEQYYPNVFVLLSVSIFREIVLHYLMAPGGNPVEGLY